MPEKHLLNQYVRASAAVAYDALLALADARGQARLRSASGPTAGSTYSAELATPDVALSDRQWSYAARWRLGLLTAPLTYTCGNLTRDQARCGADLDSFGDHCVLCGTGPWRNQRHNALCEVWGDIFEEIGGHSRLEAFVEELCRGCRRDAIIDVWAHGLADTPDILADITVRHPVWPTYMPQAADETGYTAQRAEHEKLVKYPPVPGCTVTPLAHETFGRLGTRAEELLVRCAAIATWRAHRRGREPGPVLKNWRTRLDAALMRGVVHQLHRACTGTSGAPTVRRCRADIANPELGCPLGDPDHVA